MFIFTFGPSSSPSYSFPMLLIHSAFLLCSLGWKIIQLPLNLVVGRSLYHHPLFVGIIFFPCLRIFCFVCIVLSFVEIFLIFLLSPVVLSFLLVLFFPLCDNMLKSFFLWFIIFACCCKFLIFVSSRISHPSFEFPFVFLRVPRFFFTDKFFSCID